LFLEVDTVLLLTSTTISYLKSLKAFKLAYRHYEHEQSESPTLDREVSKRY